MHNRKLEQTSIKPVIIVGGGPIGLAHAWGIKKLNPDIPVRVLEKYTEYQRSHTLILQPSALMALMNATHTMQDPILFPLLKRLEKDPHIRTNELESIFKQFAINNGVEIINEEVKPETIERQLFESHPVLIIGADGTHSMINRLLFPEGNHVKVPFDYVLQLRYEIKSEKKANAVNNIDFYQHMARHGMIANEYIGAYDAEKQSTPVTMQMMISKQAFEELKEATSKNPIKFMTNNQQGLPKEVYDFITSYLALSKNQKPDSQIDAESIRVSVNEAPATYAKQPIHYYNQDLPILLAGDAALGLSYFKGLNAGLEATAKWFTALQSNIVNGKLNKNDLYKGFTHYSDWFINQFSPKKIREVEQYSTWRIRSIMKLMKTARWIKSTSQVEDLNDYENIFDYFRSQPFFETNTDQRVFPHRKYDLVKFGQFSDIPIHYTSNKIKKIFVDYIKPYKSSSQVIQDYKQPLVGMVNFTRGITKCVVGIFTLNLNKVSDGGLSTIRGLIELSTTPAAWLIKPIMRMNMTFIKGIPLIEKMAQMEKLAQLGHEAIWTKDLSKSEEKYQLLAIANDIHRKFNKAYRQGQISHIGMLEQEKYIKFRNALVNIENASHPKIEKLHHYFSLFCKQTEERSLINEENDSKQGLIRKKKLNK